MRDSIVQNVAEKVKEKVEELGVRLHETLSFAEVERILRTLTQEVVAEIVAPVLNEVLQDPVLLQRLKEAAKPLGYLFIGYRSLSVRVVCGVEVEVRSPYFGKVGGKRGRKKRGPNGRGCHLLLEVLGFIGRVSPVLLEEVVQMALLCPSFEVARQVLAARRCVLDEKTLRRLCRVVGQLGMAQRATIALEPGTSVAGRTVCIGIDGGRLRTRKTKRGRKRVSQQRQGYETPWREPKLLTIYVLDANGRVEHSWTPYHDATLGDADAMFALLEAALRALHIEEAARVVFLGDGAPWIWERVEPVCWRLGVPPERVVQVLDYYHVTEALWDLVELQPGLSEAERRKQYEAWKQLLWEGKLADLRQAVLVDLKRTARKAAITTLEHFATHTARMPYQRFKGMGLPIGSGCVESAIRRVINLRLKAPGTFWTPDMAECFLFLRSQVIAGRWRIFITNLTGRSRTGAMATHLFPSPSQSVEETATLKTGTDDS